MKKTLTIPSFTYTDTSDPNIKRFVDRKGDWTHYWLVKQKRFVKAVNHILSLGYNKGPRFSAYLAGSTKEEIKKKLESAGDEGTRTHRAISDLISGLKVTMTTKYPSDLMAGRQEVLNDEEWDNLVAFDRWCAVYKPRLVDQDQTVSRGDFAGTFDALLVITVPSGDKVFDKSMWGKDVLILVDWKSSSGIWNEYESQLAAYWDAIKNGHKYDKFIKAFVGRIFSGIIRVGTKHVCGYEFEVWTQEETEGGNLARFEAAKVIADRHEPKFKPDIEQIPLQFFIKVPKATVGSGKKINKK